MAVLVACENDEDPIKNEGARVVITLFIDFSHAQEQLTPKSVTSIQSFMADIVTIKNEKGPLENEGTRVVTTFFLL